MLESTHHNNPFPGLRTFSDEESHLFFGRDNQVSELLAKLRSTCLLAVVGTSGSGKTSLVQGGLIPRLKEGFTAQAGDQWRIANFNPGNNPIGNMSVALAQQNVLNDQGKVEPNFASAVETALRSSSLGLANVYKKSPIKNKANLLLIIDEFEGIFKFNQDEKRNGGLTNDSLSFVNLILFANRQKDIPIYIVMTMHSDYLGDASEFRGLPEVINEGQYLIPRMKRQELRKAILAPLAVNDTHITPDLVNQMLDNLPEGHDELPILQHCLMRTWDNWYNEGDEMIPLDLEHYRAIGTIDTALTQHAEEAYNDLSSDSDRLLCEQVFKILVETSRDGMAKPRPVTVNEISALTGAADNKIINILDIFGRTDRSFLSVPPIDKIEPETLIKIKHECLMRAWGRLAEWIKEEAHSVEVYLRLSNAANLFYSGKAGYWRNPELQIGLNWYESAQPNKIWASRYNTIFDSAIDFLLKSKQEHLNKLAFEEAERQAKLRSAKRVARLATLAGVVGISLAAVSSYFFYQANVAQKIAQVKVIEAEEERKNAKMAEINAMEEKKEAEHQKSIADIKTKAAIRSEQIAEVALTKAEEEAIRAAEAKIRAEEEALKALEAKIRAEEAQTVAEQEKIKAEKEKIIANIATEKAKLEEEKARIAREEAERLRILGIAESIMTASISADEKSLQGLLAKEAYEVNRIYDGNPNHPYFYKGLHFATQSLYGKDFNRIKLNNSYSHRGAIYGVASTSGGHLFTTGSDGRLMLWNIKNTNRPPAAINESNASDYRTMALSSGGKWLICGGQMPVWEIYNLKNASEKKVITAHAAGGSNDIAILPNQSGFYSAGNDGTVLFCDLDQATPFASSTAPVNSLALTKSGNKLATGDKNGTVSIYKTTEAGKVIKSVKVGMEVTSLEFSPDGKHLAIGSLKGRLLMWDLSTNQPISHKGHSARIGKIKFNQSGSRLLTASYDGTVRVWEFRELNKQSYAPIVLPHNTWVLSATFKKDESGRDKIITGSKNGIIRYWDIDAKILADKLCLRLDRDLTEGEWAKYVQLKENEHAHGQTCKGKPLGNN